MSALQLISAEKGALEDTRLSDTGPFKGHPACSAFELINGGSEKEFWRAVHDRSPRYIQRCIYNPFRTDSPHLGYRWKRGTDFEGLSRAPKACCSHKCPSEQCRKFARNQLYSRFVSALRKVDAESVVFLVLTLPASWHRPGLAPKERYAAMARGRTLFYKRLRRWLDEKWGSNFGSEHIWAIEEHRSGVPHCNIILVHKELSVWLRERKHALLGAGLNAKESIRMLEPIRSFAKESGLGTVGTAEANRCGDEGAELLAGYLTKTVQKLAGEAQKSTQLPLHSPHRRRTWNAGKGFVPRKHKSEDYTGGVVNRRWSRDGDEIAEALLRDEIPIPKWLLKALELPETDKRHIGALARWEAELPKKKQYRKDMRFIAQIEQELAYQDEGRRGTGQKLNTEIWSLEFTVSSDGDVWDQAGEIVLQGRKSNEQEKQEQERQATHTGGASEQSRDATALLSGCVRIQEAINPAQRSFGEYLDRSGAVGGESRL